MGNYKNLQVWQRAIDLAVLIYRLTGENSSFNKDFGLKDQMRRCSVSISSNISEGDQLGTDRQAVRQFYIARGSLNEEQQQNCLKECMIVSAMLTNLIRSRSQE